MAAGRFARWAGRSSGARLPRDHRGDGGRKRARSMTIAGTSRGRRLKDVGEGPLGGRAGLSSPMLAGRGGQARRAIRRPAYRYEHDAPTRTYGHAGKHIPSHSPNVATDTQMNPPGQSWSVKHPTHSPPAPQKGIAPSTHR